MVLQRILENVQKKGKLVPQPVQRSSPKPIDPKPAFVRPVERKIDPVVARLKEARRLEREKKQQEKTKSQKPKAPKKLKQTIPLRTAPAPKPVAAPVASRPKPAKMKFSELMKKASAIDQSKLSIAITGKPKSKTPESDRELNRRKVNGKAQMRAKNLQRSDSHSPAPKVSGKSAPPAQRAPLPVRGPSQKLAQKLQSKKPRYEESEDDMDDFIASDEEEEQLHDYDRDEIWAMFNKGRKRSHFEAYDDYDSDDMEATGAEIFDEEKRSKRTAELEDKKEMEEEMRRAELKRQRKLKRT